MSRLIFIYVSDGSAVSRDQVLYDPSLPSGNHFAISEAGLFSDGYSYLLKGLKETGIFEDVLIFIESARKPGHFSYPKYNLNGYVVPHIEHLDDYLEPDDIIWARGGWRHWHNWFARLKGRHWLMVYAANTGRDKWPFWDVILDDLNPGITFDRLQRVHFNFIKPINEDVFAVLPVEKKPIEWDVCIGLSHIHEKKGQLRGIEGIAEYAQKYGRLRCVMPGRFVKSSYKHNILYLIDNNNLDVELVGMIPRDQLVDVINQSRLVVFPSVGGQNDRGPIESMACGTPYIIATPKRHHHLIYSDGLVSSVFDDIKSPSAIADNIHNRLSYLTDTPYVKRMVRSYYQDHQSSFVIVSMMSKLFSEMMLLTPNRPRRLYERLTQTV